jgi:hypothetical protein
MRGLRTGLTAACAAVVVGLAPANSLAAPVVGYPIDTGTTSGSGSANVPCPDAARLAGGGGAISFPQVVAHAPFLNSSGPLQRQLGDVRVFRRRHADR